MNERQRLSGRAAIQVIIVGTAMVIGGVASIPMMMQDADSKSSTPPASKQQEVTLFPPEESTDALVVDRPRLPSKKRQAEKMASSSATPSTQRPTIEHVRVFYATDRHLYHASNPHLWITAIAPGLLSAMITSILIAGCISGSRRWLWYVAASVGVVVSFVVCGQSVIRGGQLLKLAKGDSSWYGTSRYIASAEYPLHLGTSDVSLPPDHRKGIVERPSVFSFEFQERADRHVMVHHIATLGPDTYFKELTNRIAESKDRSALIYIHGYNVEFDEALQRTAQLSKDIGFQGAPILYSWPSHGHLLKYRLDEANVEWSVAHLERFIEDVHRRTGVKQLHVIAHSMGNRALLGALQLLRLRYPDQQPMLGQVIMAAPDMDADLFRDRYAESVDAVAQRATLYASANDRALLASVQLHGHRRLGLTSSPQPTVEGVDHVDVTPVDTSLLGHSYYGSHPLMIRELMSLVHKGIPPEQREWLTTFADRRTPPLWRFVPELAAQALSNY